MTEAPFSRAGLYLLPATLDSGRDRQRVMDRDLASEKTPATIKELEARVAAAFGRHPLCREVRFDIVSTPRTRSGANWTVSMSAIPPGAIWEASELVADIQSAYILAA